MAEDYEVLAKRYHSILVNNDCNCGVVEERFPGKRVIEIYSLGYCAKLSGGPLHGRLVFPVRSIVDGRVLSFIGRAVRSDTLPKYWHSPGNKPLYWGVTRIQDLVDASFVVLVEGPFDVIAMQQLGGYRCTAGCGGSRISKLQAAVLASVTRRVVIFPDMDEAGYAGAVKSREVLSEFGMKAIVVGKYRGVEGDPCDILTGMKKGKEVVNYLIGCSAKTLGIGVEELAQ